MPYISQSLLYFHITLTAKLSLMLNEPKILWQPTDNDSLDNLMKIDWFNPHQITALSFLVISPSLDSEKQKFITSFYFVDPRWQLTTPIDICLNQQINLLKQNKWAPNLLTYISDTNSKYSIRYFNNIKDKVNWQFLKQNNIDIQRIIIFRMVEQKIFILPYSSISLKPLGITLPITSPKSSFKTNSILDPTANSIIKKGHIFT